MEAADVSPSAPEGTRNQLQVPARSGRTPAATLLRRAGNGPLLSPTQRWWENRGVFNPGVAEGPDGVIHILYRAQGQDGVSRLGYARSRDGITIDARHPDPVFEPDTHDEWERLGVEDPRIVRLRHTYYITYTAASLYKATDPHPAWLPPEAPPWRVRVSLAVTEDFRTFTRMGVILPEMDNKDAALFPERLGGKYVLLHRLPPDIWIATSADLKRWDGHHVVLRTRPALWDERRVGTGAPPVRTPTGWLVCYHGADHHNVYRAGFALLAPDDPTRVLARSVAPALEPVTEWERAGQVPRVIFPTGMVVRGDDVLVYYGGGDQAVGVARGSLTEILASLR